MPACRLILWWSKFAFRFWPSLTQHLIYGTRRRFASMTVLVQKDEYLATVVVFLCLTLKSWHNQILCLISLKGISAEFQVICGFSQKIPDDLLSYDNIEGYLVELRQNDQNRNFRRRSIVLKWPSENRICNLLCFTVFTRAHGSDARLLESRDHYPFHYPFTWSLRVARI